MTFTTVRYSEGIVSRDTFFFKTAVTCIHLYEIHESYVYVRREAADPLPLIRLEFITLCNFRSGGITAAALLPHVRCKIVMLYHRGSRPEVLEFSRA